MILAPVSVSLRHISSGSNQKADGRSEAARGERIRCIRVHNLLRRGSSSATAAQSSDKKAVDRLRDVGIPVTRASRLAYSSTA
eukprot:7387556-Prymnesium_polylepis.2